MVSMSKWVLLWPFTKFQKTPERLIDGNPVAQQVQRKLLHSSMDHLATLPPEPARTSDEELQEGDMSALTWPHATPDPPRDMLITEYGEVIGTGHYNENSATGGRQLSKERKAHIQHKMAINQKKFEDMKATGEPMVKWINIITKMEKMMEEYSFGVEGESTSSTLKKLKGVQLDIQRVVRARFREWIGLGGRVFEPLQQEEVPSIPEKLNNEHTHSVESTFKVSDELSSNPKIVDFDESHQKVHLQPKTSSSMVAKNSNAKPVFEGRLGKVHNLIKEEGIASFVKSEGENLGNQENLTTQLTESHIMIVDEGIMESSFNYLVHILQGVTFRSWESDLPTWERYGEEIRVTKLTFQRTILQIIQFMCKFELVKKGKLESLLASTKILDLIGNHVVELFIVVQHCVYNIHAFLPDMGFVRNHWRTEYLHDIFEVMGKSQEAHFLSAALTAIAKLNQQFFDPDNGNELSNYIDDLIFKNRFFLRLESRAQDYPVLNPVPMEETEIKDLGDKLIKMFQEPIPNHGSNHKSGYFLVYHTLNYILTYHKDYMKSFFSGKEIEFDTLMKQLELFRNGCKLYQIIRQGATYKDIITFPNDDIYTISKLDAGRRLVQMENEYADIATSYKEMDNHFKNFRDQNEKINYWFQGYYSTSAHIIACFNDRAFTWDEGVESEGIRKATLRFEHKLNEIHESFPNLKPKLNQGSKSANQKNLVFTTKEILDLWDPELFYV